LAEFASTATEVKVSRLPNGLRVATYAKPINTVTVAVFANTGANNEVEAENGISHFLEHMAFKGTNARSSKDIVYEVESIGADINAFTSRNLTAYHVTGLASHIPVALDILSDVLTNSTFTEADIASEKIVVHQEINEYADQLDSQAMDTWFRTAFPAQAAGRPILGSTENVASFTREMITDYMARNYHADTLIVIGVGNVDHDTFVKEAAERFSDIPASNQQPQETVQYVGGTAAVVDDRFEQPSVTTSWYIPGPYEKTHLNYKMLALLLGGGMSSPMFQEVREARSLCYSVQTGIYPLSSQGSLFYIDGATTAPKVAEFLESSAGELAKVAKGIIADADWNRVRNQVVTQIFKIEDRSTGMAQKIASDLFHNGEVRGLAEIAQDFADVTKEDVIAAAKAIVESVPTVVVYGNIDATIDYGNIVQKALA
jgi:predicted Zn-dependent peptidase